MCAFFLLAMEIGPRLLRTTTEFTLLVTQYIVNMSANTDRIFMAEQIKVPTDLPEILKEYTKAVIRQGCETNEQVIAFSAQYFQAKVAESNAPATKEE
eukprot:Stramenopile-MAST_4_protein_4677